MSSESEVRPVRAWAIVPAAGFSTRMGTNKLFLPWGDTTVLGRLLTTLRGAPLSGLFVVGRSDDVALRSAVSAFAATDSKSPVPVEFIAAEPAPPDMRTSVEWGLARIEREHPLDRDVWLVVPADHPLSDSGTVTALLNAWRQLPCDILLPTWNGRRGHPTLFAWSLAASCRALPRDVGLNRLVKDPSLRLDEWPVNDASIRLDLDTPADYQRERPAPPSGSAS